MNNADYPEKLARVEAELAAVEHELQQALDDRTRTPLLARKGSLERSAHWYRRRLPRQREITAIGTVVHETVRTAEAT